MQDPYVDITTQFELRGYDPAYVRGVALVREPGARQDASATGAHTHSVLPVRITSAASADIDDRCRERDAGHCEEGKVAGQQGFSGLGLVVWGRVCREWARPGGDSW